MAIIFGTAGHIDHGKTSLVQALTGIHCDRLDEEKYRGITIELGFAYYDLPTGEKLGIVDVPGHEKFIKNMVAGASGIDTVMLVVAADEGIMPQTKEHIEICSLLHIKHGFIVITKTDLVDSEWLELAKEDIKLYLKDTFLSNAPMFPVSNKTGEGLLQLKAYLDDQTKELTLQNKTDLFRMPIDRAFTMKGYGTVVTGTIASGSISVGTEVELLPSKKITRVRTIQNHGQTIQNVTTGQRAAINLHNINLSDVERGHVLALPKTLFPSQRWLISLTCLHSSPKPIKNRAEVLFYHGTQETYAQLYFLDKKSLQPGETSICEVNFNKPLTGIFNDYCIIRNFSPLKTIAGGILLNPLIFQKNYTNTVHDIKKLCALPSMQEEHLVLTQIMLAKHSTSQAQLLALTNLHTHTLTSILTKLEKKHTIICFDKELNAYITFDQFEQLKAACIATVETFHKKEPLKQGITRSILSSTTQNWYKDVPIKLIQYIIDTLCNEDIFIATEEYIRLNSHQVLLGHEQQSLHDTILNIYIKALYTPPTFNELEAYGIQLSLAKPIMHLLIDKKLLIKVKDNLYYSAQALDELKKTILHWFTSNNELDLISFKNLCGDISRKYAIPLLEFFDKECLTIRVGDKRQLRKRS